MQHRTELVTQHSVTLSDSMTVLSDICALLRSENYALDDYYILPFRYGYNSGICHKLIQ
jgi:hypothetical protein